jgi:hypothetical protein
VTITPPEPPVAAGADLLRGRLMQRSLRALLDQVRGSREVLPHLAALESALGERGAAAIEQIPPPFLTKVFSQLRVLPSAENDTAMQDLITRVQRAVRVARTQVSHQLSPFDPEATVVITEGSHTDFMDALGDSAPAARPTYQPR